MNDQPRYPVAWSVDSQIPDAVRELIDSVASLVVISRTSSLGIQVEDCKAKAATIKRFLENPPTGKHTIPTD